MPKSTERNRRKLPPGIVDIGPVPMMPRITNVYGPPEMLDDPDVKEVLEQIDADEAESDGE